MKKFLSLLFASILLLSGAYSVAAQNYVDYVPYRPNKYLNDGYYKAQVSYDSHTGTLNYYQLDVKVVDDRVVAIFFPKGGALHTGKNYDGYTYGGGYLSVSSNGYFRYYVAKVSIKYPYAENPYIPGTFLYYTDVYGITIE